MGLLSSPPTIGGEDYEKNNIIGYSSFCFICVTPVEYVFTIATGKGERCMKRKMGWYYDRKEKKWKQGTMFQVKYALWEFHNYLHDVWLKNIQSLR